VRRAAALALLLAAAVARADSSVPGQKGRPDAGAASAATPPAPPHPTPRLPDRDGDGIPDALDKCPDQPETYNGFEDEDGCPDRSHCGFIAGAPQILDQVFFAAREAKIAPASRPILDAIAATLLGNPQILRTAIEGHTDGREPRGLGLRRAEAVAAYLRAKGVAAERLTTTDLAATGPLAPDPTARGRESNRRVGFKIVERQEE
jgi:outer membrane protein OmpA-like peptidoglycan-associated protein